MKLVPADAKLQKKSTPRTYAKLIDTQKITDLYEEVCTFLDTVERAWQAAERMQAALEKYNGEACTLPKFDLK
jgi:hypothetical protein